MTRKQQFLLAVASSLFGLGAFASTKPAYAEACTGSDIVCKDSGSCAVICDKDGKNCFLVCRLDKKAEE